MNTPERIWLTPDREDPEYIIWQSDQPGNSDEGIEYVRIDVAENYVSQQGVQADGLTRCHICMNIGYTGRFCYNCGQETNPPAP